MKLIISNLDRLNDIKKMLEMLNIEYYESNKQCTLIIDDDDYDVLVDLNDFNLSADDLNKLYDEFDNNKKLSSVSLASLIL